VIRTEKYYHKRLSCFAEGRLEETKSRAVSYASQNLLSDGAESRFLRKDENTERHILQDSNLQGVFINLGKCVIESKLR
jgi:hypothetical protein